MVPGDKLPVQQTSTLQTNSRDVAKTRLPGNFSGWKRAYHQLKLKGKQRRVGILEMQMSKTAIKTKKKKPAYHFLSYILVTLSWALHLCYMLKLQLAAATKLLVHSLSLCIFYFFQNRHSLTLSSINFFNQGSGVWAPSSSKVT